MSIENGVLSLIKIVTALYFENMAIDRSQHVFDEIREILFNVKVEKPVDGLGTEGTAIDALRYTAEWLLCHADSTDENGNKIALSRDNIIQRLTVNLYCDNQYIEIVKNYLNPDITPNEARNKVTEILSELRFDRRKMQLKKLIMDANKQLNFSHQPIETSKYVKALVTELEDLSGSGDGEINGLVGRVNFDNWQDIEEILKKASDSYSTEGILNTGFQGLNDSTGCGGFRRGEMINFGANTHNYKSGMLIDLALNIPVYNTPWMWDPKKKPMILRISFENTLDQDIAIMYKKLYEIEYQKTCNLSDINTRDAAKYLTEYYAKTGYHFSIESYDPNNFTIYDLFDCINRYIMNGYEIHAISCDYLSQIAHNTIGDRMDVKIQKTYEMARNFCYPKGITFLTGHQLSTEAQNILRENTTTFTKKVCIGGYYQDCKSLHTKLDLEYLMNVHDHQDGCRYLFISRGKHRGGESTTAVAKHFIRKFELFGGIVPDVNTDSRTMRKLPDLLDLDALSVWDEK